MKRKFKRNIIKIVFIIIVLIIIFNIVNTAGKKSVNKKYTSSEVATIIKDKLNDKIKEFSDKNNTKIESDLLQLLSNSKNNFITSYEISSSILDSSCSDYIYTVYIVNINKFIDNSNIGIGKYDNGDVFTLEPIVTAKDSETIISSGTYQIRYYDNDRNSETLEKVNLYLK